MSYDNSRKCRFTKMPIISSLIFFSFIAMFIVSNITQISTEVVSDGPMLKKLWSEFAVILGIYISLVTIKSVYVIVRLKKEKIV